MIRLLVALFLLAAPVSAETVRVRSGEHETFSRLVFDLPNGTEWSIETAADSLRLTVGDPSLRFDSGSVFDLIPRTRIRAIRQDGAGGDIVISLAGDVHAKSFATESGSVVIDVISGALPAKADARGDGPAVLPPVFPATPTAVSDLQAHLPVYWKRRLEAPDPAHPAPAKPRPLPASSRLADVQQAEQELLHQISRAAAQGLIRLDTRQIGLPPGPEAPARQDGAPPAPDAASDHLAIQSRTVIDRDNAVAGAAPELSADGVRCHSDAELDIAGWLGDAPVAAQIGAARSSLTQEFDRPDDAAVADLARLYIALGFGAEARALLTSMSVDPGADRVLPDLAELVEGRPVGAGSRFHSMAGCDSAAALWAVLAAREGALSAEGINQPAVTRAFSALPPHLRAWLGPDLTRRLIDAGATRSAEDIRAAIARLPDTDPASLRLVEAQIDLARDDTGLAARTLRELSTGEGEETPQALLLYVAAQIDRGERVDPEAIETLDALAFEHAATPLGARLRKAHVLALAGAERFDEAFEALSRWPQGQHEALRLEAREGLFQNLLALADTARFLPWAFAETGQPGLSAATRLALAERLADEGFPDAARAQLEGDPGQTEDGRLLHARMALKDGNAPAAIADLVGLDNEAANALRAAALQRITEDARPQKQDDGVLPAAPPPDRPAAGGADLATARDLLERSAAEREAMQALLQETADLRESP